MAIEKIKELLKAIKTDPEAQAKLGGLVKGADEDGVVRYYAEAAKKLGFGISETDVRAAVAEAAQLCAEKTEAAAEEVSALEDDALEQVAGGFFLVCASTSTICETTFKDKENCWTQDGCDINTNKYKNYVCESNLNGNRCGEKSKFDCSEAFF